MKEHWLPADFARGPCQALASGFCHSEAPMSFTELAPVEVRRTDTHSGHEAEGRFTVRSLGSNIRPSGQHKRFPEHKPFAELKSSAEYMPSTEHIETPTEHEQASWSVTQVMS